MRKITSLEELREIASNPEGCDCYVKIGPAHFSKHITYEENVGWMVLNLADSTGILSKTDEEFDRDTSIPSAIRTQRLYYEPCLSL